METHENYTNITTAKLLKEAGFDWKVNHWYSRSGNLLESTNPLDWNDSGIKDEYSAPALSVAQKWLRENKNIHLEIIVGDNNAEWTYYIISEIHSPENMPILNGIPKMSDLSQEYPTYEEALEIAIQEALKMVLEKTLGVLPS